MYQRWMRESVAMDDWARLRSALRDAGVRGEEDLGRFVDNTEQFRPSELDERAALPVLIEQLPKLTDPYVVVAVAGHLRRPWARPSAFQALREAFSRWARTHPPVGWALGDAMANAAEQQHLPDLVELAVDETYGMTRQMIVSSLWRFASDPDVPQTIIDLCNDPDVSLQAMSSLRRSLGNEAALPYLRSKAESHPDSQIREQAKREIKKAERSLRSP